MPSYKFAKLLQNHGFGGKRECLFYIEQGLVALNGETIEDPSYSHDVKQGGHLIVDDMESPVAEHLYVMLHKPANYETSHQPSHHLSVFSLLPPHLVRRGLQAVGRLDVDTTGILLFTDDGQFIHTMSSGKKDIEKVYQITCKHAVTPELRAQLLSGVQLHDEPEPISAKWAEQTGEFTLEMCITTGKYHQVKRMIAAAGNRVEQLHRSRMGKHALPDTLEVGQWAYFSI